MSLATYITWPPSREWLSSPLTTSHRRHAPDLPRQVHASSQRKTPGKHTHGAVAHTSLHFGFAAGCAAVSAGAGSRLHSCWFSRGQTPHRVQLPRDDNLLALLALLSGERTRRFLASLLAAAPHQHMQTIGLLLAPRVAGNSSGSARLTCLLASACFSCVSSLLRPRRLRAWGT